MVTEGRPESPRAYCRRQRRKQVHTVDVQIFPVEKPIYVHPIVGPWMLITGLWTCLNQFLQEKMSNLFSSILAPFLLNTRLGNMILGFVLWLIPGRTNHGKNSIPEPESMSLKSRVYKILRSALASIISFIRRT